MTQPHWGPNCARCARPVNTNNSRKRDRGKIYHAECWKIIHNAQTLTRQINALMRSDEARGKYAYLETDAGDLIRIIRARTRNGRMQVLSLWSGKWLDTPSLSYIRVI